VPRRVLLRLRDFASRRPVLAGGSAAVLLVVLVGGFLWFRPDKLIFDDVVDEAFPEAAPAATSPVEDTTDDDADNGNGDPAPPADDPEADDVEPTGPVLVASGPFTSHNRYTTVGEARVYHLDDGERIVRLEDFETTNGPDLRVYLSAAEPGTEDRSLADDFIDLGRLRGNIGAQNYEIPADVDLEHYRTVVIWCVRFTVSFGAADLALEPA
jgi:hypothetical protein